MDSNSAGLRIGRGWGGLLMEQPDSLLAQEINGPLIAPGDRKHLSCLRCRTDQIY